jgi:hypothetical protein
MIPISPLRRARLGVGKEITKRADVAAVVAIAAEQFEVLWAFLSEDQPIPVMSRRPSVIMQMMKLQPVSLAALFASIAGATPYRRLDLLRDRVGAAGVFERRFVCGATRGSR